MSVPFTFTPMGWVCSLCNRSNNPALMTCPCINIYTITTTSTGGTLKSETIKVPAEVVHPDPVEKVVLMEVDH